MTTVHKYLPVDDQGVAAAHERVVLDVSQQEAALISLLLGRTCSVGPGQELYDQLDKLFPSEGPYRLDAARASGYTDTRNGAILYYLAHFPGD